MQRRKLNCDPNRLRLLLDDALPAPAQAEMVGHLDVCERCQQALEELAADKPWWQELRRMGGTPTPPCEQERLANSKGGVGMPQAPTEEKGSKNGRSQCGPTLLQEKTGSDEQTPGALDFLDPPQEPHHLGRLDRFTVIAQLGRGGFGLVLKAHDPTLDRCVAIKVLAPYFASSGAARKRFAREAKAAATVVHPHVVPIHSVDSWKGLPYLVMSYIPGRSLQERLDREGPLELKEILRIGMQTASGLAAAHAQGLVHRDIKPANILLEQDVGPVWLTDFGLARAADDASLTQSGVIAGTPQFMAPEQAQGATVDHRADLFSLGSTLYAMCAGHPPFRADSAMAVLRRVCEDNPRALQEINPDIPAWLAGIIDKLLAKAPADRFQSAAEVADLLERCLAHVQQPNSHPLPDACGSGATARSHAPAWEREPTQERGNDPDWQVSIPGPSPLPPPPPNAPLNRLRWLRLPRSLLWLLLGVGAFAALPWGPWGFRPARDETNKSPAASQELTKGEPRPVAAGPANQHRDRKTPTALLPPDDPLEQQVEKMHRHLGAALAELKLSTPPPSEDVIDKLLRKTRQELNALERDLTAPPRLQTRGGPLVKGESP